MWYYDSYIEHYDNKGHFEINPGLKISTQGTVTSAKGTKHSTKYTMTSKRAK